MDAAVVELDALAYCYGIAPSTATDPTSVPGIQLEASARILRACAPLACSWIAQTLNGLRYQRHVRHRHRLGCWGQ